MAMDGQQERKTDKKKRQQQQQQQLASFQVLERVTSDEAPAQKKEKKRKTNENATEINGNSSSVDAFEECFSADEKKAKKKKKAKKQEPEARCDGIVLENVLQVESVKVFTNYKDAASKKDKKERSQAELCEGIGAMNNEQFHNGGTRMKEKRKHKSMTDSIENGMHSIENGKAPHDQNIRDQDSLQVTVSGPCSDDVKFRPLLSFQNLRVPGNVLLCCKDFQRPSPIQAHAWPFLLDGQDLIGIAATGSGKTLAFGLPALVHVLECSQKKSKPKNPLCLVLSPTRELAQQISEVLVEAGHPCGINTACLYGGSSKKPQLASLKAGAAIVVATPGRLVDLVEEGHCFLQDVSYVVLDEADRMLDLGFEQVVRKLVDLTSKSRQTIMFSATWPPTVHNLSKEFMKENPIKVIVGSQDLAANHAVSQIVEVIDHTARDARLFDLLKEYHKSERIEDIRQVWNKRWDWFHRPIHAVAHVLHSLWRLEEQCENTELEEGTHEYFERWIGGDVDMQRKLDDELLLFRNHSRESFGHASARLREMQLQACFMVEKYENSAPTLKRLAFASSHRTVARVL